MSADSRWMQDGERKSMTRAPSFDGRTGVSLQWLRRVVGEVSWTVIDQALLGSSNFAANLVLARWLTPGEYGGYVAASAVFWMMTSAHGGVLTEPMMVFGSGQFRDRLSLYFATLAVIHWCISAMIAAGLAAVGFALVFWGSRASGSSMLGYALATPVILLLWLLRRSFYVRSLPRLAAGTSFLYMVGMLLIMYALYRSAVLSAFTAPLSAGGASVLAVACIVAVRRFKLWSSWQGDFTRRVAVAHWRYGRWAVVSGIATWVPGSLYYLIVPLLVGVEANAALNALMILVLPAAQVNSALTFLLVPAFSRFRHKQRDALMVWIALVVLVTGAALYALLVDLFGPPLMDLLYLGRYTQYADFAWLVGLIALPTAAIAALGSALRAYERPDLVLWAYVVSTVVTCTFGIGAVAAWGLLGAIVGLLGGYVTTTLAMLWWVLRTDSGPTGRSASTVHCK
jgi:O-antigen/teichoic acid export membrane protein